MTNQWPLIPNIQVALYGLNLVVAPAKVNSRNFTSDYVEGIRGRRLAIIVRV